MVMKGRHFSVLIAVVLLAAATGRAGMTPIDRLDAEPVVSLPVGSPAASQSADLVTPIGVAPGSLAVTTDGAAPDVAAVQIASDRQNSLHLCLYALLTMGLGKSVPYVKKFSLGVVPQWYHDGGPFQIGHSQAISPDCLDSAPVYCFIQPESGAEDPSPQYRPGAVVSCWRTSQFTPSALISRGPPCMS
jgi:hypothetical protein